MKKTGDVAASVAVTRDQNAPKGNPSGAFLLVSWGGQGRGRTADLLLSRGAIILLGLRWEDVDLEAGTLEVIQTLQRVGGRLQFVQPKTEDSARTVPLPSVCLHALKNHRMRQFIERSDNYPDWGDHGLVFPSRPGTPMEPDDLRRSCGEIRKAAGLGQVRLHGLRHICVSLLLDMGIPPHIVREIVGHSDIEVTMTIYAHASLDAKRKALGKLGGALTSRLFIKSAPEFDSLGRSLVRPHASFVSHQ